MKGGLRARIVGLCLVLAALPALAQIESQSKPVAEPPSAWARGNRVLLGVTQARLGFSAQWRFDRAANGDILLQTEESRAGQVAAGSMILVGSGALVVRDLRPERGRELDSINGPLLMLQLVLRLLERTVPAGPGSLAGEVRVDLSERSNGIKVTGLGAEGEFFAPWTVKGTVGRGGPSQIRFELEFASASGTKNSLPYVSSIAGIWQNASPPVSLPDTLPLRGWRVYQLKPVVKPRGMINTLGLGASAPLAFSNLGEVRRSVVEWTNEGARRARFQCN